MSTTRPSRDYTWSNTSHFHYKSAHDTVSTATHSPRQQFILILPRLLASAFTILHFGFRKLNSGQYVMVLLQQTWSDGFVWAIRLLHVNTFVLIASFLVEQRAIITQLPATQMFINITVRILDRTFRCVSNIRINKEKKQDNSLYTTEIYKFIAKHNLLHKIQLKEHNSSYEIS
jgi:hypothetical protein